MRNQIAAKAYLGALWAVCVYRAVTQSIVHDEAFTYQLYLAGPPSRMFTFFDANHHFLNTLLMYLSTSLFGLSEWSMRLPALAGAAFYFAAVYRLCRYAFGDGYTFLLSVALLTLNPFILDFMVAARGYGMALGFWMWALAVLLPYIDNPKARTPRQLVEAALALSLSVVANLVFVTPAAILAGLALWFLRKPAPDPAKKKDKKARRAEAAEPSTMIYFVLPILGVAFLFFLVSPLQSATGADFYAGLPTIRESLRSLATASLRTPWLTDAVAFFLAPAILLAALAVGIQRRNTLILFCSVTAIGTALLVLVLHFASDAPYPMDRTGIYYVPLVLLALVALAYSGVGGKPAAIAAYTVAGALLLVFAAQWNVRKFFVWEYDADTKDIANRISERSGGAGPNSVRVGASWQLEPALNFYREKNHWAWMQPVTRSLSVIPGLDYYVVFRWERGVIESMGLKLLYEGKTSGTALMARSP